MMLNDKLADRRADDFIERRQRDASDIGSIESRTSGTRQHALSGSPHEHSYLRTSFCSHTRHRCIEPTRAHTCVHSRARVRAGAAATWA